MLCAIDGLHVGNNSNHATEVHSTLLNLTKLYTEATKLDLCVDTADVLQFAIFIPATEVTGMIHADFPLPLVFLDERTVDERLFRTLRQTPVATSYLNTCEAELAGKSRRKQMASLVNNEVPVISHRLTNRNLFDMFAWSNREVRRIVSTLRRSIDIDDLDVVAVNTRHLLTATGNETYRQVVEGVQQQTGNCRRVTTTRNLVVEEELTDSTEILANLRRHNMERATQRQHGIHILDMCIKRERTVSTDSVSRSQFLHILHHCNEVSQTCLVEHSSLRLSGRT